MLSQISPEAFGLGLGLGVFLLIGLAICTAIALFVLWIWMLIDCAQAPDAPGDPNTRVIWILILVFTGWLGAVLYYFIVRQPRLARLATAGPFALPPVPPVLPPVPPST